MRTFLILFLNTLFWKPFPDKFRVLRPLFSLRVAAIGSRHFSEILLFAKLIFKRDWPCSAIPLHRF